MITINDRVRDGLTDEPGVVVGIHNGYYMVDLDNGDSNMYLESELYPEYVETMVRGNDNNVEKL